MKWNGMEWFGMRAGRLSGGAMGMGKRMAEPVKTERIELHLQFFTVRIKESPEGVDGCSNVALATISNEMV